MDIDHSPASPARWDLEILETRAAGRDFRWIHLARPGAWRSRPGQFVNVRCDQPLPDHSEPRTHHYAEGAPRPELAGHEARGVAPLVRRPVSISYLATRPDGRDEIVLLVRVVGPGSERLGQKHVGDRVDLVGPVGNGYDLDLPGHRAFLVGGGCGIAPLVGAARRLVRAGREVTVFYGCSDVGNVPVRLPEAPPTTTGTVTPIRGVAEFPEAEFVLSTDDGSAGLKGLVTDAIAAYTAESGWDDVVIYACGPDVMMSALAALAKVHDVPHCQVSLENYMGCAVGVCLSCVARIRTDDAGGWTFKRVCAEGPIFEAADVIFENKWEGCRR